MHFTTLKVAISCSFLQGQFSIGTIIVGEQISLDIRDRQNLFKDISQQIPAIRCTLKSWVNINNSKCYFFLSFFPGAVQCQCPRDVGHRQQWREASLWWPSAWPIRTTQWGVCGAWECSTACRQEWRGCRREGPASGQWWWLLSAEGWGTSCRQ